MKRTGKAQVGILGATRGLTFATETLLDHPFAEVSAICDFYEPQIRRVKEKMEEQGHRGIAYFTDPDAFLRADFDAVIIANYANQHARYAIQALQNGKHVLSEVMPVQTPAEAVALCEAVERSGKIYRYAENYCYAEQTLEMRRRYRLGDIGSAVQIESDFINDCSGRWHLLTRGRRDHWRNHVPSTFYCTHSIGPMLFITGARPKSVIGLESPRCDYMARHGARSGSNAMEIMRLSDDSIAKSVNGNLKHPFHSSVRLIGTTGSMEHELGDLHVRKEGEKTAQFLSEDYRPESPHIQDRFRRIAGPLDRGVAYVTEFFLGAITGDPVAFDMGIDVYQALDMGLPGIFAYRSILRGSIPLQVPDFRDPGAREEFRNDHACTDPDVAQGAELLPSCSTWNGLVPDEVYEEEAARFEEAMKTAFKLGHY